MKYFTILSALVLMLYFNACSEDSTETPPPPAPTLVSIEVAPVYATLDIGTTEAFEAIGFYSDGTQKDVTDTVTWSLKHDNGTLKAFSDSLSYVEAVQVGNDTLIASLSDKNSSANIAVNDSTLLSLQINPASARTVLDYNVAFTVLGNYDDNHTQDLTQESNWATGDSSIAQIGSELDGKIWVEGQSIGDTTVTVSYNGLTDVATLSIEEDIRMESISVEPDSWSAIEGDSRYFATTAHYSNGDSELLSNKDVLYLVKPGGYNIIEIDNWRNNLVHTKAEGNATLEVSVKRHKVEVAIDVTKLVIERIATSPSVYRGSVGQKRQYFTDAILNNGPTRHTISNANEDLSYTSSNENVASISNIMGQKGLLTGRSAGTATITSTFKYEGTVYESNATVEITD